MIGRGFTNRARKPISPTIWENGITFENAKHDFPDNVSVSGRFSDPLECCVVP
jgi:hypothetical protein